MKSSMMGILNRQQDVSVTTGTVEQKLKGMPNRKSPGKQEIWLKNSMDSRIAEQLQQCMDIGNVPDWVVMG